MRPCSVETFASSLLTAAIPAATRCIGRVAKGTKGKKENGRQVQKDSPRMAHMLHMRLRLQTGGMQLTGRQGSRDTPAVTPRG